MGMKMKAIALFSLVWCVAFAFFDAVWACDALSSGRICLAVYDAAASVLMVWLSLRSLENVQQAFAD
jgi:hypothetical protein